MFPQSYVVKEPVKVNCPSTSSNCWNPSVRSCGFPVIVMPEDTCDKAPMVIVDKVSRLLIVIDPCTLSRSGATMAERPDTPSAMNEPLICSTPLRVIAPSKEESIVMLPSKFSQLVRLLTSLCVEIIRLFEPGGY